MNMDILEQMTFSVELLQQDAKALNLQLLTKILEMASIEISEARQQATLSEKVTGRSAQPSYQDHHPLVVGSWRWNVAQDRLVADPEVARLFGVEPSVAATGLPLSVFMDAIHPMDKTRMSDAVAGALVRDEPFHLACRVRSADGSLKRVFVVGRAVFENGKAVDFPVTVIDVTENLPRRDEQKKSVKSEVQPRRGPRKE